MIRFPVPLIGFAAWSGTGKTTLLCKLLPILSQRGLRTGLVKHAHHQFEIDTPGKDSYKLRKAGASEIVVASRDRIANILQTPEKQHEPTLEEALQSVHPDKLDLILVEGFKNADIPKIELHRVEMQRPYLYLQDRNIIALAEDQPANEFCDLPHLDLNQPDKIADFITDWLAETFQPNNQNRM